MEHISLTIDGYLITSDKTRMFPDQVYTWLHEHSYWAKDLPREVFDRSFAHSFAIGIVKDGAQVGFARLITDYASFAYLADVYVEESHRGKGLSKIMMDQLFSLDWVKGLRRIMLATRDAHELYKQYGFTQLTIPDRMMEISRPDIYSRQIHQS